MATDDLSDLIAQHWSADAGPRPGFGGHGTPPKYGQGTVVAWDPDTGANQIRFHGTVLNNLPIISSTDILVIRPGDQVAVMSWAPNGGSGAYFIMGRLVVPGTEAAARSIEFMQGDLAKQISAQVFAARIFSVTETGSVFTSSTSFVSLTGGPTISNVDITDVGRAIVIATAHINHAASGTAESTHGGVMSFQVSGATSQSPFDSFAVSAGGAKAGGATGFDATWDRASSLSLVEDLNPGAHTFSARYRARDNNASDAQFFNRNLTVIAF